MSKQSKQIKVELFRGLMGCTPAQRAAIKALGLKRRQQVVLLANIPTVRGNIKKVLHLVRLHESN
jgi:large subunit ribosomal protein L30